jgi:hypothetical protein
VVRRARPGAGHPRRSSPAPRSSSSADRSCGSPAAATERFLPRRPGAPLTLALCLGFAVGLVGHGVPFGFAAALYLFAHIFLLQLPERRAKGELARGALVALGIAIGVAAAVTFVFQSLFLVRLP